MHFRYQLFPAGQSFASLTGRWSRPRPIAPVAVIGPAGTFPLEAILDSAADDTVFPAWLAHRIGVDLTNAPTGFASGVGGTAIPVQYASVTLQLTDGRNFASGQPQWDHFRPPWLSASGFCRLPTVLHSSVSRRS